MAGATGLYTRCPPEEIANFSRARYFGTKKLGIFCYSDAVHYGAMLCMSCRETALE